MTKCDICGKTIDTQTEGHFSVSGFTVCVTCKAMVEGEVNPSASKQDKVPAPIVSYKCDMCNTVMPSKASGTFFDQNRVLTSPGYWEQLFLKKHGTPITEDALGNFAQASIQDNSGYTVCSKCKEILNNDLIKFKEFDLDNYIKSIPSGKVEAHAVVRVGGTIWKKIYGKWPSTLQPEPAPQIKKKDSPSETFFRVGDGRPEIISDLSLSAINSQQQSDESEKKLRGLIKYILLIFSHPTAKFDELGLALLVDKTLPEYISQKYNKAKIGFMPDTEPINSFDLPSLAIETFGEGIKNEKIYIYRMLHFKCDGGEGKCLVVYDKKQKENKPITKLDKLSSSVMNTDNSISNKSKKWWEFWK